MCSVKVRNLTMLVNFYTWTQLILSNSSAHFPSILSYINILLYFAYWLYAQTLEDGQDKLKEVLLTSNKIYRIYTILVITL